MGAGPAHTRPCETSLELFDFTFNSARTNGPPLGAKEVIAHTPLMVRKVTGLVGQIDLYQGARNAPDFTAKERGLHGMEPFIRLGIMLWKQSVRSLGQMLEGVVNVHNLDTVREKVGSQVPNPLRSIGCDTRPCSLWQVMGHRDGPKGPE